MSEVTHSYMLDTVPRFVADPARGIKPWLPANAFPLTAAAWAMPTGRMRGAVQHRMTPAGLVTERKR